MWGKQPAKLVIRGARQVLTLRGSPGPRRGDGQSELGMIPDGSVLVCDGIVQEANTTRRVENLKEARDAVEIRAAGRVVMPGFVDSHTHLLCPPPGVEAGDLRYAARAVHTTSAKRLASRIRDCLHAMARHGTTTVEAKTGFGEDERAETKVLRAVTMLRNEPVDVVRTVLLRLPGAEEE